MTPTLILLHSLLRWAVILIMVTVTATMAFRYAKASAWTGTDRVAALIFTIVLDTELLVGLVLYGVSPITRGAMKDMATAMHEPSVRFFVAEHPTIMVLAVLFAHLGSVFAKKAPTDRLKFGRATAFFAVSTGLVLWGIPWFRLMALS
ncbi:MAG: hypothetical protein WCL36_03265 [bacterium]|jgi:hypothetical protein|nr:hypothetical protein [bacterium]